MNPPSYRKYGRLHCKVMAGADVPTYELGVALDENTPKEERLFAIIEEVIRRTQDVVSTSVPGYPLCVRFSTNQLAFDSMYMHITLVSAYRVYAYMEYKEDLAKLALTNPLEFMLRGFVDPLQKSVKNVPTPIRKRANRDARGVECLGVCDQIVERVFFYHYTQSLKDFPNVPQTIGLGVTELHNKKLMARVAEIAKSGDFQVWTSDVPGWDVSITKDMLARAAIRCAASALGAQPKFLKALLIWSAKSSFPLTAMPDGFVVMPKVVAGFPSGTSTTTTIGGSMRGAVSRECSVPYCLNNGDDTIDALERARNLAELYRAQGIELREVKMHEPGTFSFCSHTYIKEDGIYKAKLETWPKALMTLLLRKVFCQESLDGCLQATKWVDDDIKEKIRLCIDLRYGASTCPINY